MMILGRGTDPNSPAAIAFEKKLNADLEAARPKGGYPAPQEAAIQASQARIAAYEAEHGVVDYDSIEAAQDKQRDTMLSMMKALTPNSS